MGLSENAGYIPNEIAIFQNGIMISKTIGYNGVHNIFKPHPNMGFRCHLPEAWVLIVINYMNLTHFKGALVSG